jgi:hypothetical protein
MDLNIKKNNHKFDFSEFPAAYMCDNIKSNQLRTDLIKNQVKISECEQGYLENVFFSEQNMDLINKKLIYSVYKKSNGLVKIPPQSKEKLLIVMRYVFLEYARHLPYNITEQVSELNCTVISEILPNIITNINQHLNYLKEIDKPFGLVPLPVNVHGNNKNLPSVTNTFY